MKTRRRRSRLAKGVQEALIVHFVGGVPARTAGELVGINRNSAILFYHKLREVIAAKLAEQTPFLAGDVEVDESYFGGYRKGKRGRGAAGKVPVFGLLKRGGLVHAVMIQDAKSATLVSIIRERVQPDSIVFTDAFRSYDVLDVSEFQHVRINHTTAFVEPLGNHINGIENFWNQAKRHLRRYNGIPRQHFHLYLKECEWRFNHRPVSNLLKCLRTWAET
jgi:transposase